MEHGFFGCLVLVAVACSFAWCDQATPASRNPVAPTEEKDVTKAMAAVSDATAEAVDNQTTNFDRDEAGSTIRFATYNVAMNREKEGQLLEELESGESDQAEKIAAVIQMMRPDVLLINEFDYDAAGEGIKTFREMYLGKSQYDQQPIAYEYTYFSTVNTGYDTGLDLNKDGKSGGPDDAYGFGQFPGKYAMVVLSRFPIDNEHVRTFQNFLWKDMPDNRWPQDPETEKPWYNDEIKAIFRLSSKSHWDVPIKIGERTIHLLAAHPTPPAFDGPENRNGARNHDEIRMWADYVDGRADYLYDDKGVKGGLAEGADFVIVGDMNADPVDGDGDGEAGRLLTENARVQADLPPRSSGGAYYAELQGQANVKQHGDPAQDTGDFSDYRVGNLRVDYCLPSKTLKMTANGIVWPKPDEPGADLVGASDHRMVWIDVEK
jgi:endonuclease/exonuclease/phosphatase family metal-dependent hydrolase